MPFSYGNVRYYINTLLNQKQNFDILFLEFIGFAFKKQYSILSYIKAL